MVSLCCIMDSGSPIEKNLSGLVNFCLLIQESIPKLNSLQNLDYIPALNKYICTFYKDAKGTKLSQLKAF